MNADEIPQENKKPEVSANNTVENSKKTGAAIEIASKLIIFSIGCVYISGFITVNAHLSKFGFNDYDISNPHFLSAGALSAIYFLCWYMFSGRSIIHGKKWFAEDAKFLSSKYGFGNGWISILFIDTQINFIFMTCISTSLFGFIAYDSPGQFIFAAALAIAFIISYNIDITNTDVKFPRTSLTANIAAKLIGILGLAICAYIDNRILKLFFAYMFTSFFANLVMDAFERRQVTADRITFTAAYIVFFTLSSIVSFGYMFYGEIRQKIGGGHDLGAAIAVRNPADFPWVQDGTNIISGRIIHQTKDSILVSTNSDIITFGTKEILWVKLLPEQDADYPSKIAASYNKICQAISLDCEIKVQK